MTKIVYQNLYPLLSNQLILEIHLLLFCKYAAWRGGGGRKIDSIANYDPFINNIPRLRAYHMGSLSAHSLAPLSSLFPLPIAHNQNSAPPPRRPLERIINILPFNSITISSIRSVNNRRAIFHNYYQVRDIQGGRAGWMINFNLFLPFSLLYIIQNEINFKLNF